MKVFTSILLFLFLVGPSLAEDNLDKVTADFFGAGEKIPVAVLDLDAKGEGLDRGVAEALTESVRHELFKKPRLNLVARDKMLEVAKEKAIQLSGCTDVSCAVRVGKALNVKKMITGSLVKLGSRYYLYLKVIDIESEGVECSEKLAAGSSVDSLDLFMNSFAFRAESCIWLNWIRAAVKRKPNDAYGHFALALSLMDALLADIFRGDQDGSLIEIRQNEAIAEVREAVRLKPEDMELLYRLNVILFNYGKKDEIIKIEKEYSDSVQVKPDNLLFLKRLAFWLDSEVKRKEARPYWDKALKVAVDPVDLEWIKKRLSEPD